MSARKHIGSESNSLTTTIIIVAVALVLVVGMAVGLAIAKKSNNGATATPDPNASSEASSAARSNSAKPSASQRPSAEKSTTSTTPSPSTSVEKSMTTSHSNTVTRSASPLPLPSVEQSEPSSRHNTKPDKSSTSTTKPTPEITPGQDFGTGRSDVDGLGFTNSAARCHNGDRAFAIVATEKGSQAAACERRDGSKYYRGAAAGGSLESPIIVDEGNRIVAQNGAYKYQMSPDGLMITKNNEVQDRQKATTWGVA